MTEDHPKKIHAFVAATIRERNLIVSHLMDHLGQDDWRIDQVETKTGLNWFLSYIYPTDLISTFMDQASGEIDRRCSPLGNRKETPSG